VVILIVKGVLLMAKNKVDPYQPEGFKQYAGLNKENDMNFKGDPTTSQSTNKEKNKK
jgi:hypothetical protein